MLLLHNLDGDPVTVDIGPQQDVAVETPREVFADDEYPRRRRPWTGWRSTGTATGGSGCAAAGSPDVSEGWPDGVRPGAPPRR